MAVKPANTRVSISNSSPLSVFWGVYFFSHSFLHVLSENAYTQLSTVHNCLVSRVQDLFSHRIAVWRDWTWFTWTLATLRRGSISRLGISTYL